MDKSVIEKNVVKVGRKPILDSQYIFEVLEANMLDIFKNGFLNPPSHKIWKKLSEQLDYKILPKTLYISVFQDRYKYQTKLRTLLNIDVTSLNLSQSSSDTDYIEEDIFVEDKIDEHDDDYILSKNKDKTLFVLKIPYEIFLKIKPIKVLYKRKHGIKSYNILKPGAWTDIINDAFLKEYRLPCNYIYKTHRVNFDCNRSNYYFNFHAKCMDNKCPLFGWCEKEPNNGEPLVINIFAKDTRGEDLTHTTKRPLKGDKRIKVGKQLSTDLASNWRRHNISNIEFGRLSPPNIYNNEVLRKTKQQFKDKTLGITEKCPFKSLVEFKHNSQYSGSIHTIGIDPLLVHYWTTHQLIIYKDLRKSYCKVSIDATGGLVKTFKRTSLNLLSSHVFLYEAVVNTNYGKIPITQMVSERHDILTIFNWLGQWVKSGIRIPNEAVCDYSFALLGAITRAFCDGKCLNSYVEQCFDILIGKIHDIPVCYVRIDVAHIIKNFCRIKHLVHINNKQLKNFYIRGLRLLVTSINLNEFDDVLTALLTIMYSETDGFSNDNVITPSERSRQFILEKIKGIEIDNTYELYESNIDCEIVDESYDDAIPDSVKEYLDNIEKKSRNNSLIKGDRISAYFVIDLAKDVLRICKHFPLWTCVMSHIFKSPYTIGSSAPVESDFSELKKQILRYDVQPMSVDRFVIKHLQSIDSNTKLFRSSQLRNDGQSEINKVTEFQLKSKSNVINSPISNSDTNSSENSYDEIENWRGKGKSNDIMPKLKDKVTEFSYESKSNLINSLKSSDDTDSFEKSYNEIENIKKKGKSNNITLKLKDKPKKKLD